MTATANLAIEHIAESQDAKEVTANEAFDRIDAKFTARLSVSVAAGNGTVTLAQAQANAIILATGASVAGREIAMPAFVGLLLLMSAAANAEDVTFTRGTTDVLVSPAQVVMAYLDGTANGMETLSVSAAGGGSYQPLDSDLTTISANITAAGHALIDDASAMAQRVTLGINDFVPTFTFAGEMVDDDISGPWIAGDACTIPGSLAGTRAKCLTNPGADLVLTVQKNGAAVTTATVTISSAGTVTLGANSATAVAAGDALSLHGPASADATVRSVGVTIPLTR